MKDAEEKVSILIVDDRLDKLLAYEVMVAELNQNVVRARSGKEALRRLLQQDFAVILLDVNMPGMDGFETAALIRQRPRSETTPIIFISAVSDTENYVARGYSLGAVDYILMPVVPEILRAKIAVFVDLFKKTEQVKRQAEEHARLIREQAARAEAEARQERLGFLAGASNVLAGSLEYQEIFQHLANLIVPRLADFCVIYSAGGTGEFQEAAIVSYDQQGEPNLQRLAEDFAAGPAAKHGSTRILQIGESKIFCDMSDNLVKEFFDREEDRELIRSVAASFIAVPIRARGGVLGTIMMVNTRPERKCGPDELSLAEELVQRAALALDNARLYRAAQNARTEAEKANSAKDQFLAMLSHELRTPLMPVLTSVLAIENEEALPANIRESLQMIRRNVELEARLIDDLLDLTRISKGKVQLNFEIVDAHKLLRNAFEICQAEIEQKHLALHLDFAARKVRLKADPARLQQIFWNLIKNAVKFTPKGGQLSIRTSNDSTNQLCVEVVDTGVGIDPEALPKIFNAFEQGGSTQLGGLGLGLAISKALAEIHKGTITAESAGRNKGAKFTAFFPTSVEKSDQAAPAASHAVRQRQSMRILLVEDHEDTNRSLTNLLRRRGYHVQSAGNLQSALDLSAKEEFDVLISDLGLPDGSGIDLMQTMHSERPLLGIALTGFGMEDDIRKSRDAGFKHHLVKPIDLNKLDSLIQEGAAAMLPPAVQSSGQSMHSID